MSCHFIFSAFSTLFLLYNSNSININIIIIIIGMF